MKRRETGFIPSDCCLWFVPLPCKTQFGIAGERCLFPSLEWRTWEATHSATASDLQKWYDWANNLASSVGSTFVYLDNSPDLTLLRRELKWLVEDAIEEPENVDNNRGRVRLRVEIEELYMLWKQRVEERRPFRFVVGCEHWRDLVLCVEEGVLIPRPEIDLVGSVVLGNEGLRKGLWADLGTGRGAIAIGIARVLGSGGRVIATDLSPAAIGVAAFNVQRYGLQDVVELRQAEVGRHEPRVALDGGINGMDDLLHLCKGAAFMLKPGGFFAFETNGEEQCNYLVEYMENDVAI